MRVFLDWLIVLFTTFAYVKCTTGIDSITITGTYINSSLACELSISALADAETSDANPALSIWIIA